jgi:ribosomal protein S18 acetylase RimI-like enzyme
MWRRNNAMPAPPENATKPVAAVDCLVKQATALDASLLTELGKRSFYEAFSNQTSSQDMQAHLRSAFNKKEIENQLNDARSLFLIVETQPEPAGYAFLFPTVLPDCIKASAAIQLVRFYLVKKYYGRGVGNALMQSCLEESRAHGYHSIWLSSWELNHRANAFYKKWHFKEVGRQKFTVGSDVQNDIIFSRRI